MLTRDARLFLYTGDRRYADDYWAQVNVHHTRDRAVERLRALHAPADELALIERAKRRSDALILIEVHALRLVFDAQGARQSQMPTPVAIFPLPPHEWSYSPARKLALARKLLLSPRYAALKARMGEPLREFQRLGERRVDAEAASAQHAADRWMGILLALTALFVLVLGAVLWVVHSMVGRPVARYASALRERDADDHHPLDPLGTVELRLLAEVFNDRLQSHREARTDALTGLPNRRALMSELELALAGPAPAPSLLVLYDLDGFKLYNDTHGHPAGDALLTRLAARLEAVVAGRGRAYRLGGDEFCVLLAAGRDEEQLLEAAAEALRDDADGATVRPSFGVARLPEEAADTATALKLADQRMYLHKEARRPSARSHSHDLLLRLLDEQQSDLHLHSAGVASLAQALALRLGLGPEECDRVTHAAELHDIGKVAIPAEVLRKPGPLTDEEWASIRDHTVIGERILGALPALAPVARIVRSTHERYDGGGYPDGLAGQEIPLAARIIAVCDAFDAMTSERPYHTPRDAAQALGEIERCAGTQFDPRVVAALRAELGGRGDATLRPAA
jgi:diguanylate cyclase (GGDEF)-like protein